MRIGACQEHEVPLVRAHLPSEMPRYDRQMAGLGTLLVAWLDDLPVGSCEVKWDGCSSPDVQAAHPGCPEINGLGIWPPRYRGQGLGTGLVHAAEDLARERGASLIGLGASEDNTGAWALYQRLGYRVSLDYIDRWSRVDETTGETRHVADPCTFLVKSL